MLQELSKGWNTVTSNCLTLTVTFPEFHVPVATNKLQWLQPIWKHLR